MAPQIGERYTVVPHTLPHGLKCGRWHCEIRSDVRDGKVVAQEIKPEGRGWRRRMSTSVFVDALVPLEVQLDLFGDPAVMR